MGVHPFISSASSSFFITALGMASLIVVAQLLMLVASVMSQTPPPPPPSPPPPPPPALCVRNSDCPSGSKCKNNVCVAKGGGCFPGDALVETFNGEMKFMKELSVGDKVAVSKGVGGTIYSDIYAFGHKDVDAIAEFLEIKTHESNTIELTSGHFVPTLSEAKGKAVFKRAQELMLGDIMFVTSGNSSLLPSTVTEISMVEKHGLFNPLTLTGSILVDGVVASVHSDWFLDSIFNAMGVSHWLPFAYQTLLSPARLLYHILGKEVYATAYALLDGYLNVAEVGTEYGGMVTLTMAIAALMAASKGALSS